MKSLLKSLRADQRLPVSVNISPSVDKLWITLMQTKLNIVAWRIDAAGAIFLCANRAPSACRSVACFPPGVHFVF